MVHKQCKRRMQEVEERIVLEEVNVQTEPNVDAERASLAEEHQDETGVGLHDRILDVMQQGPREGLPSLKSCDRAKLKSEVRKINDTVKLITTRNISELNGLMYAAAYVTTERMGKLRKKKGK